MKHTYCIYWGEDQTSYFRLKSMAQAKAIAKQYPNVKKVEKIY